MLVRDRIIEESAKMFATHGIRSVTMDDISSQLGVSKRTIYEHFKDKDELLESTIMREMELNKKNNEAVLNKAANQLEGFLENFLRGVDQMKQVNVLYFSDLRKYYPHVFKQTFQKEMGKISEDMKLILEKGIAEQVFRSDINVEIASLILKEQMSWFIELRMDSIKQFPVTKLLEHVFVIPIRGLATEKGIRLIDGFIDQHKEYFR